MNLSLPRWEFYTYLLEHCRRFHFSEKSCTIARRRILRTMTEELESRPAQETWIARTSRALSSRYREYMERMEDRLASRTTDRVVREFDWGLDWTKGWPCANGCGSIDEDSGTRLGRLNKAAVRDSESFFAYQPPTDFKCANGIVRFASAIQTPYPENNVVHAQWFPASRDHRRAVLVLPHWNAQEHQHVALCRALRFFGISALRLSLPYHDLRMPAELHRADYAVSSNIARTIDATRQAVIDARSCLDWLQSQGYESFGIVGTSLGSCYAFLTSAHDRRLRANAYNLFSLYFSDVVWTGLTTRHIRQGLYGHIELEQLRDCWEVIAPHTYLERYAGMDKKSLFIYGNCDTTFLPEFSKEMIKQARLLNIELKLVVLPCGHYTLGETPFKYIDGYQIVSFFLRCL
jgi:hypothetical protein